MAIDQGRVLRAVLGGGADAPHGEPDHEWRNRASCRDTDPDLFFPVGTTHLALPQIDWAKSVCRACEVRTECLRYALETNQEAGVWGGTSEEERRKLRRAWLAGRRARLSR